MQTTKHIPVMLEQSINGMNIQKKGIYIDATYGFGGHSNKILSLLDDEGRLFAVDKDINSIKMKKTIYALFVDLAAAFDHIVRELMFDTILKRYTFRCQYKTY